MPGSESFRWSLVEGRDRCRLALHGAIDGDSSIVFSEALLAMRQLATPVTLDLTGVTDMDGSGMQALMGFCQSLADLGVDVVFGWDLEMADRVRAMR